MLKKTSSLFTLIIMISFALSACKSITGTTKLGGIPGSNSKPLPGQAQTEVANLVSDASKATQAAGVKTPVIAGSLGLNQTSQTTAADSAASAVPGVMVPVLDWSAPWVDFLRNLPKNYDTISVDDLEAKINSSNPPFLLDVRDVSEISQFGHIPGAVNIPYRTVLQNLDKLPGIDQTIVVYSSVGHRGTISMAALRLLGYKNVYVLDGGMTLWLSSKKPVDTAMPITPAAGATPQVDSDKITDLEKFMDTGTYGVMPTDLSVMISDANKPVLIDVRDRSEITKNGTIAGSVEIPLKSLFKNLNLLPADKTAPIIVYDTTGHRGTIAMMALRMNGYTNVRSLFGGLDAWVSAGLPTSK